MHIDSHVLSEAGATVVARSICVGFFLAVNACSVLNRYLWSSSCAHDYSVRVTMGCRPAFASLLPIDRTSRKGLCS